MKITLNKKLAAAVGIPLVLASSVGLYRASVHEQNCLSYESQLLSQMDKSIKLGNEVSAAVKEIHNNPFTAFAYLGMLSTWTQVKNDVVEDTNNIKYAYGKTCGSDRLYGFFKSPKYSEKYRELVTLQGVINSYKF